MHGDTQQVSTSNGEMSHGMHMSKVQGGMHYMTVCDLTHVQPEWSGKVLVSLMHVFLQKHQTAQCF